MIRRRLLGSVPALLAASTASRVGGAPPAAAAPLGGVGRAPTSGPEIQAAELAAVYFPETGQHLRAGFLDYWRRHEGPQRLGYPLTEEQWDPTREAMVQQFSYGHLEWRPPGSGESAGSAGASGVQEFLGSNGIPRETRGAPAGAPLVSRESDVPNWRDALAPPAPALSPLPPVRQGRAFIVATQVDDPAAPLVLAGGLAPGPFVSPEGGAPLRYFAAPTPAGNGQPYRFIALAAVPSDAPLGHWVATATAHNALGLVSPPERAEIEVVDGGFTLQRLSFAADLVPLLAPEVGELERLTLAAVTAESVPAPRWRGRFRQPVVGQLVTRHGARRDYLDPTGRTVAHSQHAGVDLAVPGGTPIAAPAAGVVAFTGHWSIRGNVVIVDHGAGVHTVHAHAADIAVAPGQSVAQGQVLGWVGSTGLSTGPHLHWEVRVGGVAVEPLEWTQRDDLALTGVG